MVHGKTGDSCVVIGWDVFWCVEDGRAESPPTYVGLDPTQALTTLTTLDCIPISVSIFHLVDIPRPLLDNGPVSSSPQHRCTQGNRCSVEKIGRSLKRNVRNSPLSLSLEWHARPQWIHSIHRFFNLCRIPLSLLLRVCILLLSPSARAQHPIVAACLPVRLQPTQSFRR